MPTPAEQLRDAVVEAYLETGKALDSNEIATRIGWSVSKVRRVMKDNHGCVAGLTPREEQRESHSTSYRGFVSGSHKVWVYGPTLETLRGIINTLRTR